MSNDTGNTFKIPIIGRRGTVPREFSAKLLSSSMMYCVLSVTLVLAANLVQLSLGQSQARYDGQVFQVYPRPEDVPNGTTPLYFALMQSFSGGYRSSGGIPGLMIALDEINSNSTVLPGYSLHYTLSDNAVGLLKN